ncbi:MAG: hypothetical protein OXI73_11020 [Rhodospirillales bacterium]|nr:hypothetical protein [Rhodospirillales bacterium]
MKLRRVLPSAACLTALALLGCSGGGDAGPTVPTDDRLTSPPLSVAFPRTGGQQHYGVGGVAPQTAGDARQMPVYHDGRHLMVGVDQGAGVGRLAAATVRGDTTVRHGQLRDGVGADVLARYLSATVDDPALRWKSPPVVRFGGEGDQADYERVVRAVQLVNTILPEDRKVRIASNAPSADPGTGIHFRFSSEIVGYWGITHNSNSSNTNQITSSRITIYGDYTSNGDRQATILLAHELLHALGMFGGSGHVPPDLDSILEAGAGIYDRAQGIPQPLSLLYPADREAMRALYTRLTDGASPTSFGSWSSTSQHVAGVGRHSAFGVALRNGYAEPWAYGLRPATALANNRSLSGSATWVGTLLGLTPSAQTVAGDAAIGVDLATMQGTAAFTELESWASGAAPGAAGTGAQWLDGDLAYAISIRGNTFRRAGGDAGTLTGVFVGRSHEGATGTLERPDLTAAFGASR